MRLLGRDIYWSEPQTEQRSLERVTDIGIAFSDAISQLTGQKDSSIPAVRRAVQFIADTVASLHMEQYFGAVRTDEQPKLLSQPNSFETYHDTMNKVMLSLLYRGNSFIWAPTRNSSGFITSIYVVNPDEVTVNWDSRQLYPVYEWRGTTMDLNEDFFHIAINKGPGDLKGMGPIEAHRAVLSGIKAEQNMARRLMEDEATPSGLLEVPWKVTKAEAEFVQDLWESKHQGRKRPGVLGGGIKFTPLTIDPVDAQFIEQRQFSVQEVARMFGLHGSFLLAPSSDSLTYATTESLFRMFLTATLRPTYLERIEQTFSLMLPLGYSARFNTDEILKADMQARYLAHQIAIQTGFKTVNEVRGEEGLGALVGGDELRQPTADPATTGANT